MLTTQAGRRLILAAYTLLDHSTRMKRISLYFLLAVAMQTFCFADVTKLPGDVQKMLRKVSHFREVHAAANLPPAVFALCADSSANRSCSILLNQKSVAVGCVNPESVFNRRILDVKIDLFHPQLGQKDFFSLLI